ncbi:MAG: hypothetical protein JXA54_03815 [Candidatus Heimdallarchaeota archaeon]|nr:hypothetical protein [Candidatus Heimdallarchaeota archaeon]
MNKLEKKLGLKKEFSTIQEVISNHLSNKETKVAKELIKKLIDAKKNNNFTKHLLYDIVLWKSQRRASLCLQNKTKTVNKTFQALSANLDEKNKIKLLRKLWGVGLPVASAILTIYDPINYGIIDYKTWQILYLYELVGTKPMGIGFSQIDWLKYLQIIRNLASEFNVKARDIDRTLFDYHKFLKKKCC